MPTHHAKLSPSSASRWLECPASIRMEEENPQPRRESPYAREGTIAHTLAELKVSLAFDLIPQEEYDDRYKNEFLPEFHAEGYSEEQLAEMHHHTDAYAELVKGRAGLYPDSDVMVEQRLNTGVPGVWGTSDTVVFSPEHVEIIDFKYGSGVRVPAERNAQLRLYGLGALDNFGDLLGEVRTVRVTVFQPRLDHVDTEELSAEQIRFWREEVVLPKAREALGPNARFGPSEAACRWCPVAAICRVRVETSLAEDFGADPEVLTDKEVGATLGRIPQIRAWATRLENYALDAAYSGGKHIPGYKVVMSGGRRTIEDPAAAVQILIDNGFTAEQVAQFKTKPLGELEKLVGAKDLQVMLKGILRKSEGKPSLVVETDKRSAISPESSAKDDFGTT